MTERAGSVEAEPRRLPARTLMPLSALMPMSEHRDWVPAIGSPALDLRSFSERIRFALAVPASFRTRVVLNDI